MRILINLLDVPGCIVPMPQCTEKGLGKQAGEWIGDASSESVPRVEPVVNATLCGCHFTSGYSTFFMPIPGWLAGSTIEPLVA